jgi:hypothetical protein
VWEYQTASGSDTHYSLMKGSKANLEIIQDAGQQYKPTLYIAPVRNSPEFEKGLMEQFKQIQEKYPGVELKKVVRPGRSDQWEVIIPDKYKEGHESHFARVTENFLNYFKNHNMPAWEVPNMLAKYYTTTRALEMALKNK